MDEIAKELSLNLNRIPTDRIEAAKNEVGEFIVNEILRSVSSGRSPVMGRGSFKALNAEYAEAEKGGNRLANLELEGDMLDALEYRPTGVGVKVGIFESSQVPKADGHNNFSGDSKLPTRRFIPDSSESFNPRIENGINRILDGYRVDDQGRDIFDLNEDLFSPRLESAVLIDTDSISIEEVLASLGGDSIV